MVRSAGESAGAFAERVPSHIHPVVLVVKMAIKIWWCAYIPFEMDMIGNEMGSLPWDC